MAVIPAIGSIAQVQVDFKNLDSLIVRLNNHSKKTEIGNETVQYYAAMFYTNASLYGYKSKEAKYYLNRCEAKIDSFGYGQGYEWDAFQDGTMNDKNTNYSITLTEHMLPLIYGYKKKAVKKSRIVHMVEAFKKFPLADTLKNGDCIAYSDHPNDIVGCVHNTNISCAKFIERIKKIGLADKKLKLLQERIIQREISAFIEKDTSFYYWDKDKILCDQNHLSSTALQMYDIPDPKAKKIALLLTEKILSKMERNVKSLIGQCAVLSIDDRHYQEMYKVVDDLLNKRSDYQDFDDYRFDNPQVSASINYYFCLLRENWLKRAK
jgi:hypothetical protein